MNHFFSADLMSIDNQLSTCKDRMRGKAIFISGITGFIGKCLLESLLYLDVQNQLDLRIFSISRNPEKFYCDNPHFKSLPQLRIYQGNLNTEININNIEKIDYVIHAAADVVSQESVTELFKTCSTGTENLLKFSKELGCQKFLLLSSGAVYGRQPIHIPSFQEDYIGGIDLKSSKSAYALGKQVSEWIVQQAADDILSIKIARCFAFVGPYLPITKHFAIGNFINSAIKNVDIEIMGDGTPLRTYLYTSDLCVWLLRILLDGKSSGVWNVGSDDVVSIRDLAEIVRLEINPSIKINIHKAPGNMTEQYIPSIKKMSRDFGLAPRENLKLAIRKTAEWNIKYGNI